MPDRQIEQDGVGQLVMSAMRARISPRIIRKSVL